MHSKRVFFSIECCWLVFLLLGLFSSNRSCNFFFVVVVGKLMFLFMEYSSYWQLCWITFLCNSMWVFNTTGWVLFIVLMVSNSKEKKSTPDDCFRECICQAHKVVLCDSKTLLTVVPIQLNSNLENFPRPGMMFSDGIANKEKRQCYASCSYSCYFYHLTNLIFV